MQAYIIQYLTHAKQLEPIHLNKWLPNITNFTRASPFKLIDEYNAWKGIVNELLNGGCVFLLSQSSKYWHSYGVEKLINMQKVLWWKSIQWWCSLIFLSDTQMDPPPLYIFEWSYLEQTIVEMFPQGRGQKTYFSFFNEGLTHTVQ